MHFWLLCPHWEAQLQLGKHVLCKCMAFPQSYGCENVYTCMLGVLCSFTFVVMARPVLRIRVYLDYVSAFLYIFRKVSVWTFVRSVNGVDVLSSWWGCAYKPEPWCDDLVPRRKKYFRRGVRWAGTAGAGCALMSLSGEGETQLAEQHNRCVRQARCHSLHVLLRARLTKIVLSSKLLWKLPDFFL